jgi:hypothetical protein
MVVLVWREAYGECRQLRVGPRLRCPLEVESRVLYPDLRVSKRQLGNKPCIVSSCALVRKLIHTLSKKGERENGIKIYIKEKCVPAPGESQYSLQVLMKSTLVSEKIRNEE